MRLFLLIAFVTIISSSASLAIDQDLVMYLPMDEGTGDVVKDMSPNKLNGKITGGKYNWVDGKRGKCLELTAEAEIQVPDSELLDGMSALTIEIWLRQETHQNTGVIQKGDNWPNMSYLLQPWSDQQIYFGIKTTDSRAIAPAGSYQLGKWYHLAGTFDGKMLRVYVDGELKSEAKAPVDKVFDTDRPLQIGNRFAGLIDEFVMYKRALSEAEIKRDMAGVSLAVVSPNEKLPIKWARIKSSM